MDDFTAVSGMSAESIDSYSFSPDDKYLLIETETEIIYRYSTKATNYVWDIKNKTIKPLSDNGKQRLATFSPQGDRIAFVRDNNIFVKDLSLGKEEQITKDGVINKIINGIPDWVY